MSNNFQMHLVSKESMFKSNHPLQQCWETEVIIDTLDLSIRAAEVCTIYSVVKNAANGLNNVTAGKPEINMLTRKQKSDNTSTSQINTSQHILSASQTTCRSHHGSHFSFCLKSLPKFICQSKPGLLRGTLQCQPSDVPQISQLASTTSFLFP